MTDKSLFSDRGDSTDENINRLIIAANIAFKGWSPLNPTESDRKFARALISKVLEGMNGLSDHKEDAGYDAALTEIYKRAGIAHLDPQSNFNGQPYAFLDDMI